MQNNYLLMITLIIVGFSILYPIMIICYLQVFYCV